LKRILIQGLNLFGIGFLYENRIKNYGFIILKGFPHIKDLPYLIFFCNRKFSFTHFQNDVIRADKNIFFELLKTFGDGSYVNNVSFQLNIKICK